MTKPRALVQDDKAMFSSPASMMLKALGFDVDVSQHGAMGWQMVQAQKYDIIFSDVEMPNMNGFEFLARVRKDPRFAKIPVVMCTTLDKPEHIQKAKTLGANFYAVKPMTQEGLQEALKKTGFIK